MSSLPSPSLASLPPKKWHPLESNPSTLQTYAQTLGFETKTTGKAKAKFVDLLSFDDWGIDMLMNEDCGDGRIVEDVLGVIFLYRLSEKQVDGYNAEDEVLASDEKKLKEISSDLRDTLFFSKQTVSNACGTMAVLHLCANLPSSSEELIIPNSWLQTFLSKTEDKTPTVIATMVHNDDDLERLHASSALNPSNNSPLPSMDEQLLLHFITYTRKAATSTSPTKVYHLDGRRPHPVPLDSAMYKLKDGDCGRSFLEGCCKDMKRISNVEGGEGEFACIVVVR